MDDAHVKGLPTVCAVTMVKDDHFFLKKWMQYYGGQLGVANLFVIAHGDDQEVVRLAQSANVIRIPPRRGETVGVPSFDADRFHLINNISNGLVRYFDYVITVDVDEIIVVDPKLEVGLREYLATDHQASTITPVGLDVFHKRSVEEPLDQSQPILSQRRYCKVEPLYCKPAITRVEIKRSKGNHASDDKVLRFGPDLYLFHLKWIDYHLSLRLHFGRHVSRQDLGRNFDSLDVESLEFPLRDDVEARFTAFDSLELSGSGFDFSAQIETYKSTWRRRRFLLQREFWRSVLSRTSDPFSRHWRFDLVRFPHCHEIPSRFSGVF